MSIDKMTAGIEPRSRAIGRRPRRWRQARWLRPWSAGALWADQRANCDNGVGKKRDGGAQDSPRHLSLDQR